MRAPRGEEWIAVVYLALLLGFLTVPFVLAATVWR